METKVTELINVNGVVLTPKAISELSALQEDDNTVLKDLENALGKLGLFLAMHMEHFISGNKEKAQNFLCIISNICDTLEDLHKP